MLLDNHNRAQEYIGLRDRLKANQGPMRSLWQSVSDLIFPQTYGLTTNRSVGQNLMTSLFDTTAVEEAENMTSGLVTNLFPPGQRFFAILPLVAKEDPGVKRYVATLTELTHEAMFNSNFLAQVSNTIHYWLVFGMGALYSEWTPKHGLNYRDYAIGTYQCREDDRGIIDTIVLSYPKTARQLIQQFGESGVTQSIRNAYALPRTREEHFDIVQVIQPREDYDEDPTLRPADRAPFESVFVCEKDQMMLGDEGGFDEFPFAIPRYSVVYNEVYGRGLGTKLLPSVRRLNRMCKDYLEMADKWVNPPKEVLESFEGNVDVTPGALNFVVEPNTIRSIEMGSSGAYPVTKDILEYFREDIRDGFYRNAFQPITPLQGDRRNQMEIIERLKEGMKRLSKPMGRLFDELLASVIGRSTLLLMRNGQVPLPPPQLQGFKIEFINPLALALRDQQSRGLQMWVAAGAEMAQAAPQLAHILDNVEEDEAYRDLGESLGVKTTHIRPVNERDERRQVRAAQQEALERAEATQLAAEGYNKTTKAPEDGSPAAALMGS